MKIFLPPDESRLSTRRVWCYLLLNLFAFACCVFLAILGRVWSPACPSLWPAFNAWYFGSVLVGRI